MAAAVYEFSPYVLPYISRTSALLLPWALLPWMCGVAMSAGRRWLAVAAFGFLVLSSGGLNATALLMIAPGPLIWIVHQWRTGQMTTRRTVRTVFLLGFVSILASAWWLAGLFVQARHGAAVLSYSESLVSTAATSTAPEVLRGLGYWLFYDRNDVVALTSASAAYQDSLFVLAAGGALTLIGLWGILGDRRWRWPLMTMVLVGSVLAIGPHPFDDPSPLWSLAVEHPKSAVSMALRSSTRAVPLIVLALALGIGSLLERRRANGSDRNAARRRRAMAFVALLVLINAPAVVSGDLIDPSLTRPETLPQAWNDAATYLDQRFDDGYTGSVLLLPGIESAAYRWGYPVDPILPALTKKAFLSRDWLPLGSAPLMDLLYALDDAFQAGTASAESVAPVARLLGADTVMVVTSHQYERFGTVRPEAARALLGTDPPGLTLLETFGAAQENRALQRGLERWSEDVVAHPMQAQPEILLYAVEDASSPTRISENPTVVGADGSGVVDLGALGLLDGTAMVLSEAALDDQQLETAVSAAPEVIVTDSNRRRAHHWRSSQEVWGATESRFGVLLADDLFDSRLPVFPAANETSQTLVEEPPEKTGVLARASAYGPQLTYWPEYRPAMAIDGDLSTSWRVGVDANPVGQMIRIEARGQPLERLRLVQPFDISGRWITAVDLRLDDGAWAALALDRTSRTAGGQSVELPAAATTVTLRIATVAATDPFDQNSGPGVGFSEILEPERVSTEVVQVPTRLNRFFDDSTPVSFAFTRWRSNPLDRWRQDPETSLQRSFVTPWAAAFEPTITVRLSPRIGDAELVT
ncbi:MAG: alpha-(1-_3)-arabinofuranosyltransferase domain-containing protein, partial [Ilumatobacteraceae bacterium]